MFFKRYILINRCEILLYKKSVVNFSLSKFDKHRLALHWLTISSLVSLDFFQPNREISSQRIPGFHHDS